MKTISQQLLRCLLLAGVALSMGQTAIAQFNQGGGNQQRSGSSGSATAREYPNNTQVGDATITVDPETRKVIVITDEETNIKIKDVIHRLDKPRPQVLIKVVFLEVTHNNSFDVGVEGGLRKGLGGDNTAVGANAFGLSGLNSAATGAVNNVFGQNVNSFAPTPPGAGLYQVLGSDYQVTLRAIAQAGKTEVLSRPSILVRNNQPATISLGQQVPVVSNTRFDAVNGQINTVSYQNVGIILRVTPFITPDGMVEMIVSPETSSLAPQVEWVPLGGGAKAPVINSRVADTVVVVPDSETVIIGGLMQTMVDESESKIPLLGDIPWIGNAFKHKSKSKVKRELIIFLTPHVIAAATELASLTVEERTNSLLKPKSIPQEELDHFLKSLPNKGTDGDKKKGR